jgi:phosphohistidine phosphatase SixA
MRLFLVRHAEAAPGEPDELRTLTEAGRAVARAVGEQLRSEHPDAVVSSPLLRARETAEAIARANGLDAEVDERLAPGADGDIVRAVIDGKGEAVVVVGHQPDCSEAIFMLTGRVEQFAPGELRAVEL